MSAQSSSATRPRTTAVEPDELVPSRYAQKVGAIDVLVISDGVLPIPAQTIAHNIEPAIRTDSAPLSAKLLKNGTLKTYKNFPHGMPTTNADTMNK